MGWRRVAGCCGTEVRMADATKVLLIPGWHGSPDGHWQTIWERGGWRHARRIEQRDWVAAERADWVRGVEESVTGPVSLVAHSLGVLTVAHWAAESGKTRCVAGAFLVAPPDPESMATFPAELASFANVPMGRLPFPAAVVGSETDPYARLERVEALARAWGARLVNVGAAGHINAASGHGEWTEGKSKAHRLTCFQQCPDPLQAQLFPTLHADDQSPACATSPPSGSSCMRQDATPQ